MRPRADRALGKAAPRVVHDEIGIEIELGAQAIAGRAGAERVVEREQPRLDLRDGEAGHRAGEALGEDQALRAALVGIQELGAAVVGDKTMVDAWDPAVSAYQAVINTGGDLVEATGAAAKAAERGQHATAAMQARKGRASYIGVRTIGHEDPGAASTVLILRALATTVATAAGLVPTGAAPLRRRPA